jgi:hypothetical protein
VSALVTFTKLGSPGLQAGLQPLKSAQQADDSAEHAAVHCGTAMELVTPVVGSVAADYTFAPDAGSPRQLPPVWRCGCGFQLDAGLSAARATALCA